MNQKVLTIVEALEGRDGEETEAQLKVHSHWNRRELVVLEMYGEKMTVDARDIGRAIENATNQGT